MNKINNDLEVAHPQSGSSSTRFLVELEFRNVGSNVKFERDLLTTNEEYRYAKSHNFTDVCIAGANLCPHHKNV